MRRIVSALLLASTTACPSKAAIFGLDDREYVSTAPGSPYSPIGLVKGFGAYTTGTLINRCDVLTVEHSAAKWRDPTGERVTFLGAIGSGHQRWSDGTIIAAGGISLKRSERLKIENTGSDWMIARLDDCLGDRLGWARLGTGEARPTEYDPRHLQEAGFPMDRDRKLGLSLDPACAIRGVAGRILFHDCATMPGNSGGPIFRLITINGVQRMEILGIVSAAYNWSHHPEPVQGAENTALAASNVRYTAHPAPTRSASRAVPRHLLSGRISVSPQKGFAIARGPIVAARRANDSRSKQKMPETEQNDL